jgi:hypothetical protein
VHPRRLILRDQPGGQAPADVHLVVDDLVPAPAQNPPPVDPAVLRVPRRDVAGASCAPADPFPDATASAHRPTRIDIGDELRAAMKSCCRQGAKPASGRRRASRDPRWRAAARRRRATGTPAATTCRRARTGAFPTAERPPVAARHVRDDVEHRLVGQVPVEPALRADGRPRRVITASTSTSSTC